MASEEYYDNFFSHDMCHITPAEVIQRLDNNPRRLKRKDDKIYRIFICPSQEELDDLIRQVTGQQVTEFEDVYKRQDQLCLSTNYFSDLVKKETGMSAITVSYTHLHPYNLLSEQSIPLD